MTTIRDTPHSTPPQLEEVARAWAFGGHVDDAVQVTAELSKEYWGLPTNQRTLAAAVQIVAHRRKLPPIPVETETGPSLYAETIATIRRHYHLEHEWDYVIVALFILQARVVTSLPAVFYLYFGGRYGTGKTNILRLIADLTDGMLLENVSVTALARTIENGKVVCIDEFDVSRGREVDEIRDALVRQGYKASAAPYLRWDILKKAVEPVPIYSPKALAFRGAIDDALQSRGILIPTATPKGEEAYNLVTRNLYPEYGAIPAKADLWGRRAIVEFPPERVQTIAESEAFRRKVKTVVAELGANRDSELMTVALLTAEIAGVDVLSELRSATEQREAILAESSDEAIGEIAAVVSDMARAAPKPLEGDGGFVRIPQARILEEVNRRRKQLGKLPLGSRRFASCRRELRVKDEWMVCVHKASVWNLPLSFVAEVARSLDPLLLGPPGPLTPPFYRDVKGNPGELGDPPRASREPPPLPRLALEEDLFGGRPTRGDRARAQLGADL